MDGREITPLARAPSRMEGGGQTETSRYREGPRYSGSAGLQEGPEVGQAGRAGAAAAGAARDLVEGEPFLAQAALDLREGQLGAFAARHTPAPLGRGFGVGVRGRAGGPGTHGPIILKLNSNFNFKPARPRR